MAIFFTLHSQLKTVLSLFRNIYSPPTGGPDLILSNFFINRCVNERKFLDENAVKPRQQRAYKNPRVAILPCVTDITYENSPSTVRVSTYSYIATRENISIINQYTVTLTWRFDNRVNFVPIPKTMQSNDIYVRGFVEFPFSKYLQEIFTLRRFKISYTLYVPSKNSPFVERDSCVSLFRFLGLRLSPLIALFRVNCNWY